MPYTPDSHYFVTLQNRAAELRKHSERRLLWDYQENLGHQHGPPQ